MELVSLTKVVAPDTGMPGAGVEAIVDTPVGATFK